MGSYSTCIYVPEYTISTPVQCHLFFQVIIVCVLFFQVLIVCVLFFQVLIFCVLFFQALIVCVLFFLILHMIYGKMLGGSEDTVSYNLFF